MKKVLLPVLGLLTLVGCSRMVVTPESRGDKEDMIYLRFDSEEILRQEIVEGTQGTDTKSLGRNNDVSLFSSVKEVEIQNDPILSYEYAFYGDKTLDENTSLYYRLGYDELVPNKGFARLLNARGEFAVGDTMYKISPKGTYYFPVSLREEFEKNYSKFEAQDGKLVSDKTYELASSIYRFATFEGAAEIASENFLIDDAERLSTRSTSTSIIWSGYPVYEYTANNCFNNQVFTYSLPDNRRVWTKVYHHDYIVYDERGALIKCQKNGFWGWTAVTSEELTITWKNIILQGGHDAGEMPPPHNITPTMAMTTYPYMGYNEPMAVIRGYVLPDSQLNNVVTGGNTALRSIIFNSTGIDIGTTKILRLVGHDYVQYLFVGSWFVSASNTKEKAMALSEEVMGRTYVPVGGQFWYQALDDNGNLGALRVGTAF